MVAFGGWILDERILQPTRQRDSDHTTIVTMVASLSKDKQARGGGAFWGVDVDAKNLPPNNNSSPPHPSSEAAIFQVSVSTPEYAGMLLLSPGI